MAKTDRKAALRQLKTTGADSITPAEDKHQVEQTPVITEDAKTPAEATTTRTDSGQQNEQTPVITKKRRIGRPTANPTGLYKATSLVINTEQEKKLLYIADLSGKTSKEIHELAFSMFIDAFEKKHGTIEVEDKPLINLSDL